MAKDFNTGLTALCIKAPGRRTKLLAQENSHMPMGTRTKDNGRKIRPMAMGSILTLRLKLNMKVTGKTI